MRFAWILAFAAANCLFGQSDGITASVSRTVVIQPDEARFGVSVTTSSSTTLEQVLQALNGTGIQASDLVGQSVSSNVITSTSLGQQLNSVFTFALIRPVDSYQATATKLETLRTTPSSRFSYQYSAALGASASLMDDTRRQTLAALLADARGKAQTMATAANLTLGAVRSLSDLGGYSTSLASISFYSASSDYRVTYSLSVRFAAQ